ncbi:hypothetical protein KIW84_057909 [Lathyrus oleraceus]|uniref:DUF7745 domain-containing protein n=1 Tax=Pisum sativum TaxID=3888 RepID=A0A9D5ANK0_PEA|nr:hypothetical protein KIW84_057909 [Pisum sativum]
MSLTNDDIVWYDPSLSSLEVINSCGEFSNVPLIGLFYQEGKAPKHVKQEIVHAWHNVHRKGIFELGPCNCVALEAYMLWVKKRALELKMPYPYERPMSLVVVEPLTLPNQDLECKDKDALIELLEDRVTKTQREPEVSSSSSMPRPSFAWKKIVYQLVLENAQMKTSFEIEI